MEVLNRNLQLQDRSENIRNLNIIPIKFDLKDIKKHFDEAISLIDSQFAIYDNITQKGKVSEGELILRSQLVLAEAALDFFIHEMSKYGMYHMFMNLWEKSQKYDNFTIPMNVVEDIIEKDNSNDCFFKFLNERFSREVYLSEESMKDQLNLVGINFPSVMEKAFPEKNQQESLEKGKNIIKDLFRRRNEIAHQMDRNHSSAQQGNIDKMYVDECLQNIKKIACAIIEIAIQNDQQSEQEQKDN